MEEKLVIRGAKIGSTYRVDIRNLEPINPFNKITERIMRVLYIAKHNTTDEYLVLAVLLIMLKMNADLVM